MTDDNNARYRSDPFASSSGSGSNDPLAELARLIGQNDPYSEPGRDSRAAAPREPHFDDHAPQAEPSYADRAASEQRYDSHPEPRYENQQRYDNSYPEQPALPADWNNPTAAAPTSTPSYDPFAMAAHRTAADQDANYAPKPDDAHGFQAPFPLASDSRPMSAPHAAQFYDDAPQGRRRKGMITVAAVLCLAVVGTAGAFGYRTMFSGSSAKAPPPVIKASSEPSKVAPPPAAADASNANKISYDRFGDRGQNEKVVAREEKPVDLKDAVRSGAPRPASADAANSPASVSPGATFAAGNPPSVLTEPKRVRTVPIRPDMPDTSAARPQMAAVAPAARPAPAAPSNAPLDLANPAAPAAPVRAAAPRPAPSPPANAPLSLSPDASPPPATSAAPARAAPTRVASAPAGNGSYLVQVASQRSEADAQAAYRSIQSKYSGVLGERQVVIRRAELAGKGTYFRAMVGPFTTRDQAIQLCSSLKSAGGDCVVQGN